MSVTEKTQQRYLGSVPGFSTYYLGLVLGSVPGFSIAVSLPSSSASVASPDPDSNVRGCAPLRSGCLIGQKRRPITISGSLSTT